MGDGGGGTLFVESGTIAKRGVTLLTFNEGLPLNFPSKSHHLYISFYELFLGYIRLLIARYRLVLAPLVHTVFSCVKLI